MHNGNEQTYTVHTHTHTRRAVCWPHFTFTTNDHVLDSAVTVRVPSVRVASRAYRESIHSDELICMPSAQQQRLCLCIDDNLIVHESHLYQTNTQYFVFFSLSNSSHAERMPYEYNCWSTMSRSRANKEQQRCLCNHNCTARFEVNRL